MADWADPTITSIYSDVIDKFKARDIDAITLNSGPASGLPIGAIKYDRVGHKFQEWSGSAWVDIVLAVAGGGTGGSIPGGGGLGLGTMSLQNANTVAITGGSIVNLNSFSLACDILFTTDGSRNIGSSAVRPNNIYIRNGLVIPVGTDKWVTA